MFTGALVHVYRQHYAPGDSVNISIQVRDSATNMPVEGAVLGVGEHDSVWVGILGVGEHDSVWVGILGADEHDIASMSLFSCQL